MSDCHCLRFDQPGPLAIPSYVVFYIKEEKSITVESVGGREASYDDFLNDLQRGGDSECRSV